MGVEYRRLRAAEVDAAADLWVDEHQDPNPAGAQHQAWRRQFRTLPDLLSHTWAAVADDGALLSIGRYLRVPIHSVAQWAGRLSHIFTRASACRHGHATRLLELMLAAMTTEGCRWSILSASEEGQPLNERHGWRPLPLRKVSCAPSDQQREVASGYVVRPYDPEHAPGGWATIQQIHRVYNAGRSLTAVRDWEYWRHRRCAMGPRRFLMTCISRHRAGRTERAATLRGDGTAERCAIKRAGALGGKGGDAA
jgi:hypothetical protein